MQIAAIVAAARESLDVLMVVTVAATAGPAAAAVPAGVVATLAAALVAAETPVAEKTEAAIAPGAANAPIAAAMVMVKMAVGMVRPRTESIIPAMRSRNISRPRVSRCFTASSLSSSASATARTDLSSR